MRGKTFFEEGIFRGFLLGFRLKNLVILTEGVLSTVIFVVDAMLGKLATWLRILGYDARFDPALSWRECVAESNRLGAVLLTRRKSLPGITIPGTLFNVASDRFDDQIRAVIAQFGLDTTTKIFTRCLSCNVAVQPIGKPEIRGKVPDRTFDGFDEFFQCPQCLSVYWGGTHRTNTLNKLQRILSSGIQRTTEGT